MMHITRLQIIFMILLNIILLSCSKTNETNEIKDRAGNSIVLPEKIESIVSASPAITEILIDLNLDSKITACDTYSKDILVKYNEKYKDIESFDLSSPDAERIIAIDPDIVLVNSISLFAGAEALDSIKNIGICVVVIPYSASIKSIEDDILFIADIFNEHEKGKAIVSKMNLNIEKIKSVSSSITNKRRVYFELGFAPSFYTFGDGVFLNEMVEIIGAENVFKDDSLWINVSEENIISKNPDVILSSVDYVDDPVSEILNRNGWQNIDALKNKDVYYIESTSLANHNIIKGLVQMAKSVYSNEYNNFTLE